MEGEKHAPIGTTTGGKGDREVVAAALAAGLSVASSSTINYQPLTTM